MKLFSRLRSDQKTLSQMQQQQVAIARHIEEYQRLQKLIDATYQNGPDFRTLDMSLSTNILKQKNHMKEITNLEDRQKGVASQIKGLQEQMTKEAKSLKSSSRAQGEKYQSTSNDAIKQNGKLIGDLNKVEPAAPEKKSFFQKHFRR